MGSDIYVLYKSTTLIPDKTTDGKEYFRQARLMALLLDRSQETAAFLLIVEGKPFWAGFKEVVWMGREDDEGYAEAEHQALTDRRTIAEFKKETPA